MTMLSVPKDEWESYTDDERFGISQSSHVILGTPAEFVDDEGQEWLCWDDGRFNVDDIATVAILLDDPSLIAIPADSD